MGMVAPTYWTAEMVRELPDDGNRYEVVYGELLVTPAPRPWHEILFERSSPMSSSCPSPRPARWTGRTIGTCCSSPRW